MHTLISSWWKTDKTAIFVLCIWRVRFLLCVVHSVAYFSVYLKVVSGFEKIYEIHSKISKDQIDLIWWVALFFLSISLIKNLDVEYSICALYNKFCTLVRWVGRHTQDGEISCRYLMMHQQGRLTSSMGRLIYAGRTSCTSWWLRWEKWHYT